jgi:putative endopeptidase
MDTSTQEKNKLDALKSILSSIDSMNSSKDVIKTIALLHSYQIYPYFQITSGADLYDSSVVRAQIGQSGVALPSVTMYTDKDFLGDTKTLYLQHISNILAAVNVSDATTLASSVFDVESQIANFSLSTLALRNLTGTYNPYDLAGLKTLAPDMEWDAYISTLKINPKTFILQSSKYISGINHILTSTPLATNQAYLKWITVHTLANYFTESLRDENFEFFGKVINGRSSRAERWSECVDVVDTNLGQILGRYYVDAKFSQSGKVKSQDIMNNVLEAMKDKLQKITWMDDSTKTRALNKLSHFRTQIGYPDVWEDNSKAILSGSNFATSIINIATYSFSKVLSLIDGAPDLNTWGMTTPTVNAYYDPSQNGVVMPAGILQGLYFVRSLHTYPLSLALLLMLHFFVE